MEEQQQGREESCPWSLRTRFASTPAQHLAPNLWDLEKTTVAEVREDMMAHNVLRVREAVGTLDREAPHGPCWLPGASTGKRKRRTCSQPQLGEEKNKLTRGSRAGVWCALSKAKDKLMCLSPDPSNEP